jgi:hypothetical protein
MSPTSGSPLPREPVLEQPAARSRQNDAVNQAHARPPTLPGQGVFRQFRMFGRFPDLLKSSGPQ